MNRNQIVDEVSKRTGENKTVVRSVITSMIEVIRDKLVFGLNVNLTDLVSFVYTVSPETRKKNPQTGKEMIIPKRFRIKTNLATSLKKQIREKTVH